MSEKSHNENAPGIQTELEKEIRTLRALYKASTAIHSILSFEDVIKSIVEQIVSAFDSTGCAIELWHRDKYEAEVLIDYSRLYPDAVDQPGKIYYLKKLPATLEVLETAQSIQVRVDDPDADITEVSLMREQGLVSLLMVPLATRNRVVGILEIYEEKKFREYTPDEIRLAHSLASQGAVAIENARVP